MDAWRFFRDRADAGQKLAPRLRSYRYESPLVLGLPCGGVPVAYEVARELGAPLDVCVVRKLRSLHQEGLGLGAVAEDGSVYVNRDAMLLLDVSEAELATLVELENAEVHTRIRRFRHGEPPIPVFDKTVIVVDDGVVTGDTARAAIETLRQRGAGQVVLALPVGAAETLDELAFVADELVTLHSEVDFRSIGEWYEDFTPTSEEAVIELLDRARRAHEPGGKRRMRSQRLRRPLVRNVRIPAEDRLLEGKLTVPPGARGIVLLFAHGGGGRDTARNLYVAAELQKRAIATMLLDLLTHEEEVVDAFTARLRFDIELLALRLVAATDWLRRQPETKRLAIGYFGASTGVAAALIAAAERPDVVHAIVSRGGRPDLAETWLTRVRAPTLLLVGADDPTILRLNRAALDQLRCETLLEIVPKATHLFEESGALETVARSTAVWFRRCLQTQARDVAI